MLETRKKTIDGCEYSVTQLGGKEGRRLLTRLLKVAGPGMTAAARGQAGMAEAFATILTQLSEGDIDYLCDTLARTTAVRTSPTTEPQLSDVFDVHFAGNYLNLVKWLAFSLEVNFGSFLALMSTLSVVSASPASPQASG